MESSDRRWVTADKNEPDWWPLRWNEVFRHVNEVYVQREKKRDIQAEMQKAADDYQEYKKKMQ